MNHSQQSDFVIQCDVLLRYVGKSKDVTIPHGVCRIEKNAFRRKNVTRVSMPDTVTTIGWDAFSDCQALQEIRFSRALKTISPNAFFNCNSLSRVTFFEGIEHIGGCAFSGCSHLQTVDLPPHPIEIGHAAFDCCPSLADENGFVIVRNTLYGYNKDYPREMHIPHGITYIQNIVSRETSALRHLSIPSSVEKIDNKTFSDSRRLETCTLAFSVKDSKEAERLVKKVFSWVGLGNAYLNGELHADEQIIEIVKKQIAAKSGRLEFLSKLVRRENPAPLSRFLACIKKLPLDELDNALEVARQPAVRAILLEYKQTHYTPKDIQKAAEDTVAKELGLKPKTLADWRKDFKIIKKGDHYVITGFKETYSSNVLSDQEKRRSTVTVPARIGQIPVVISERVFHYCYHITTIIIEDGAKTIGDFCFVGCRNLQDVYVPASVTHFGCKNQAFYCHRNQPPFKVHTPTGSAAEQQAKTNGLPIVSESF